MVRTGKTRSKISWDDTVKVRYFMRISVYNALETRVGTDLLCGIFSVLSELLRVNNKEHVLALLNEFTHKPFELGSFQLREWLSIMIEKQRDEGKLHVTREAMEILAAVPVTAAGDAAWTACDPSRHDLEALQTQAQPEMVLVPPMDATPRVRAPRPRPRERPMAMRASHPKTLENGCSSPPCNQRTYTQAANQSNCLPQVNTNTRSSDKHLELNSEGFQLEEQASVGVGIGESSGADSLSPASFSMPCVNRPATPHCKHESPSFMLDGVSSEHDDFGTIYKSYDWSACSQEDDTEGYDTLLMFDEDVAPRNYKRHLKFHTN